MKEVVKIIGGGLAGSEAAYYLAKKGYNVKKKKEGSPSATVNKDVLVLKKHKGENDEQ